jgi:hypothetical protein
MLQYITPSVYTICSRLNKPCNCKICVTLYLIFTVQEQNYKFTEI